MSTLGVLHFLWLVLLGAFGYFTEAFQPAYNFVFWTIWLVYALLWMGILRGNKRCARVLIVPPILMVLASTPLLILGIYWFLTGNSIYTDSPATLAGVIILAVFANFPAWLILTAYWHHRRALFGRIK